MLGDFNMQPGGPHSTVTEACRACMGIWRSGVPSRYFHQMGNFLLNAKMKMVSTLPHSHMALDNPTSEWELHATL